MPRVSRRAARDAAAKGKQIEEENDQQEQEQYQDTSQDVLQAADPPEAPARGKRKSTRRSGARVSAAQPPAPKRTTRRSSAKAKAEAAAQAAAQAEEEGDASDDGADRPIQVALDGIVSEEMHEVAVQMVEKLQQELEAVKEALWAVTNERDTQKQTFEEHRQVLEQSVDAMRCDMEQRSGVVGTMQSVIDKQSERIAAVEKELQRSAYRLVAVEQEKKVVEAELESLQQDKQTELAHLTEATAKVEADLKHALHSVTEAQEERDAALDKLSAYEAPSIEEVVDAVKTSNSGQKRLVKKLFTNGVDDDFADNPLHGGGAANGRAEGDDEAHDEWTIRSQEDYWELLTRAYRSLTGLSMRYDSERRAFVVRYGLGRVGT